MGTLTRSWTLVRASWSVLMADKELLLLPLLSSLVTVAALALFVAPLFLDPGGSGLMLGDLGLLATLFGYYLLISFAGLFFNVALVGAALERLQGGDPNLWSGLGIALRHIGGILVFSLISATVGVLLSALRGNRQDVAGDILSGIAGAAWSIVTFLVVPVMIVEGVNPFRAIGRSFALLRQTWGEQLVGTGGVGLVFALAAIPAGVLGALAIMSGSGALAGVAVVLAILYVSVLGILSSALNQVYRAAIYLYATTGRGAGPFDGALMQDAFRPRQRFR